MTTSEIIKTINDEWSKGNITYYDGNSLVMVPASEFVSQSAEGLLYDLNRDTATLTATSGKTGMRYINDIATAHVIEYLMENRTDTTYSERVKYVSPDFIEPLSNDEL